MKFYLVKLLTNKQGQDGSSIAVYNALQNAQVEYHRTLASFHNADDVEYAVVEILDEYGRIVGGYSEAVDHRPEPETEE